MDLEGIDPDDLDSVLFGGSDPPADGSFDPFLPGLGNEDGSDDDVYGVTDDAEQSDDSVGVIRYGRFGGQDPGGFQQNDIGPLPWERGTDQPTVGESSARARTAADTGNRNVGRIAEQRSGGSSTGLVRRQRAEGVASSIADAQERIREQSRIPLDDDERRRAVKSDEAGEVKKITRTYERQSILTPPQFQECFFEATLVTLKSNVTGDWIITLKVPPEFKSQVFDLGDAYGLALTTTIVRKRYTKNGD